jgi:bifunctional non-homologous end joining protein LigD
MPTSKLKTYRSKRDFSKTREPVGVAAHVAGNRFVVHMHHATADHYDLRLEHGGVLKCWAVPKGPSLNPADKRLAVETEDHPVDYLDFEGVIPEGEYGGGPMIVWDTGVWAPMEDADKAIAKGAFKFRLSGEKLNGGWMLTRLKPKDGEEKRNWLLFKERDQAADTQTDILATRPESVKSGRRIEELATKAGSPKPADLKPGRLKGAVKAPMPARIEPQLATPISPPPNGPEWIHEIKFDGYRTAAHLSDGKLALITRSGLDWTKRYRDLEAAFRNLPCKQAIIDGEIVVPDDQGITRLPALQDALSRGESHRLVYYAFDLLYLDGWKMTDVPLVKRKETLTRLLAGHTGGRSALQYSDHVSSEAGAALYDRAAEMGLEGIISKRGDSPYISGRSRTWTKTKARKAGDFVIAGYRTSEAAGGLAALGLAEWVDGDLRYVGKVGTGFDAATILDLHARLEGLREGGERLEDMPKDILPVRPVLTAHIHYGNRTSENYLAHAVYKGLRGEVELSHSGFERKRLISDADLATIWVTNPTRRLFGKSGPTKLDIAVYYAAVGDFMLPHLFGRPVSLFRCPTALQKDCFFQRHPFAGMPGSMAAFETKNTEGDEKKYISVEDAKGYLALAQFGVVEFHVWGATRRHLDKPDRVVFDLDPGEGIAWREVVAAANHVRGELEGLGLQPFVKTSGGSGIHIVVPTTRKLSWKNFHQAAGEISIRLAATASDTFTTTMGKENRKRRIFIDYHRNARGATAAAAYSLRSRTNAPASTPLNWDDLESIDDPKDLNYSSLPALLEATGDPWANINDFARDLPAPSKARD